MGELIEAQKKARTARERKMRKDAYLNLLLAYRQLITVLRKIDGDDAMVTRMARQILSVLYIAVEFDLGYKPDLRGYDDGSKGIDKL